MDSPLARKAYKKLYLEAGLKLHLEQHARLAAESELKRIKKVLADAGEQEVKAFEMVPEGTAIRLAPLPFESVVAFIESLWTVGAFDPLQGFRNYAWRGRPLMRLS